MDLPDALFALAKKLARDRNVSLGELVVEGLQMVVVDRRSAARFRLVDHSFGEGAMVEGLSESDWERLRELSHERRGR